MSWWGNLLKSKSNQPQEKRLTQVDIGQTVLIKHLQGEPAVCQRLREMGFCEKAIVKKMADSGALICKVCDTKIIISKELAENIIVSHVPKTVLLSQMSVGQSGKISKFVIEGDDCERLEEMGLTPGENISIVRYAPMGDPIEVKIRGYLLSLRKEEADRIEIELN